MRVFVAPDRDEMGKFRGVVRSFPELWGGSVLDIGCRSRNLERALPAAHGRYCGLDIVPPADVVGNLEAGLPFEGESFDTVVALDVLEHTNGIHGAFGELCRVSRRHVLLTLPNAYDVTWRIRFLLGARLSGKYGLPVDPPPDRHRWFFGLRDARRFAGALAGRSGFRVAHEGCLVGPRRGLPGVRFAVGRFPNLLAPSYVALLERTEERVLDSAAAGQ
jgi:hypothetical protein